MKKIFLTLFSIGIVVSFGQDIVRPFEDSTFEGNMIRISSFNYYSSNKFNNDLMDKFIYGGNITTEIKNKTRDKNSRINVLGAEVEQKVEYFAGNLNPFKKVDYGLVFTISDNHLVSGNISNDLFSTALYGNAENIGDTMDFSFSHFQYQHFQKVGFGIFEKRTMSSLQLSYVGGSRIIEGSLNDSYLLSENDSITLKMKGSGYASDKMYPYMAFQGHGFALDLNYNFLFTSPKGNNQIINLSIGNLGMIFWNNKTNQYNVDSTTVYKGFDIQDFIGNDEGESRTYDFMDTLGIKSIQSTKYGALPVEIVLQKIADQSSSQKLQYILGFKAILVKEYSPYIYAGVYYKPINDLSISSRIAYGGFGGLKWGLNLNYWIKERAAITVGTFDMIGNISKTGYGRGINFAAQFKF